MIRINLLPVREIRERRQRRRVFVTVVAGFLVFLLALAGLAWYQQGKIEAAKQRIAQLERQKKRHSAIIAKINRAKKMRQALDKKVEVIKNLKRNTALAAHILDEIANLTPPQRLWLTALRQEGSSLSLQGVALDNATIAQYMEDLAASPYFGNTELLNSSLQTIAGKKLKAFSLRAAITPPKPAAAKDNGKADSKG